MEWIWQQIQIYKNEIAIGAGIILTYLSGKLKSVKEAVTTVYSIIEQAIKFFGGAITEADGNGGKVSFSRILGVYVTFQIIAMAWIDKKQIPEEMMTLFWVTIGYAMVSKVIQTASPLVQDLIKAYLLKVQKIVPKTDEKVPS